VAQLSSQLTQEELVGWAAFFELKNEQEDKAKDRVQTSRGAQTMRRR
jgi:hypothetical protein|tara:strand:- start:493 stop:633 length:141 start_codon:yes stop_codon:yes gene_type:complete